LEFEKDYFDYKRYMTREKVIKSHVLKVLDWASKVIEINLLKGAKRTALDVGCACGYSSEVLEQLGYRTVAVDLSKWGVRQAKKSNREDFVVCDAQTNLPFKDGSFDLVTCFDVLEHLKSPESALTQMLRICNGAIVCTTPNGTVEKYVKRIIGDQDETHINSRSASHWKRNIVNITHPKIVRVDTFLDFSRKIGKRFIHKSFNLPKLGSTVRVAIVK
jgi:2-polyprenyl-3-methyl-5-hydroxy-6-metoxy-1,4-benzoquinol methylase